MRFLLVLIMSMVVLSGCSFLDGALVGTMDGLTKGCQMVPTMIGGMTSDKDANIVNGLNNICEQVPGLIKGFMNQPEEGQPEMSNAQPTKFYQDTYQFGHPLEVAYPERYSAPPSHKEPQRF